MKKYLNFSLLALFAGSIFFSACSSDDPQPQPQEESSEKYVLITLSDRVSGNKAGFISTFDKFPTGVISNIGSGSLEGQGMGGWRKHGNSLYKMFRTTDYKTGIEKLHISPNGTVTAETFLASKDDAAAAKYNGTGNFVIENDNSGYYWDAAEPTKIQKFNPTTMKNTGSLDLSAAINERGVGEEGIIFRSVGQKFLAIKNGKLYANLTYAKGPGPTQIGFFDDFYEDVFIAVINLSNGAYEETIKIEDTGSIAYINENHMYDFDSNGDLYIVTQGRTATGGRSKISRIKANETDIDQTWELKFSDFRSEDNGKFVGVFAKNGKLIVTLNTETLTGGPAGNINSKDIWKFYTVNLANNQFEEIKDMPAGTNPGAAMAVEEVDGKIYLRGAQLSGKNGYYLYNEATNSASLAFEVSVGGAVSGFTKISINN